MGLITLIGIFIVGIVLISFLTNKRRIRESNDPVVVASMEFYDSLLDTIPEFKKAVSQQITGIKHPLRIAHILDIISLKCKTTADRIRKELDGRSKND